MKAPPFAGTRELLNTLFVMTPGAYVRLENETVRVDIDGDTRVRVPLHHLGSIVTFGALAVSPGLMMRCADEGRAITFLDMSGRFRCRVVGRTTGNVLLRAAQHAAMIEAVQCAAIARALVAGKLHSERGVMLRGAREAMDTAGAERLRAGAEQIARLLEALPAAEHLDEIRGYEGQAAAVYFAAFDAMISSQRTDFRFDTRSRRPPRDRLNALLSYLYALLANDVTSALEGVGLDPQFGYLHAPRPGRPALALDLMEEFRAPFCDRLALTLVNRKTLTAGDFDERPGGAVLLGEDGRKKVVGAYQQRKQRDVQHPFLKQSAPAGLFPHLQARILARHLRGDTDMYVPFVAR